jgi:dTDP-4-amino-4,6-dideoxy-D-galactose acyltransferase
MSEWCSFLDWDSAFFGRRIARVTANRLTDEQANQALAWCAAERIDCLYFLAESDDADTVRAVEARGFALVDVRLTLERRGAIPALADGIRLSSAQDVEALKMMARTNHRDTRFYYDGHFSVEEADHLYETWIERSCNGYADAVLVAERDGQPAGYITCDLREGYGQIGLLGVGEAWQGQGIGRTLINGALRWFAEHDLERVEVVTQGRNVRAQRVYQRAGFVSAQMQLWYHRWFTQIDLT